MLAFPSGISIVVQQAHLTLWCSLNLLWQPTYVYSTDEAFSLALVVMQCIYTVH